MPAVQAIIDVDVAGCELRAVVLDVGVVVAEGVGGVVLVVLRGWGVGGGGGEGARAARGVRGGECGREVTGAAAAVVLVEDGGAQEREMA